MIDDPRRQPPWIAWHKLDGRPIHHTLGRRLLADAGHDDATLRDMGDSPVGTGKRLHPQAPAASPIDTVAPAGHRHPSDRAATHAGPLMKASAQRPPAARYCSTTA